jgi:class 3 adenylate cyclase/tetratricopeptide (TPR) repeat protein
MPVNFKFCGNCGHPFDESIRSAPAQFANERRDVSVLFADVSGFTSMCETMDPEDVFTLMNDVFEGLGKAITEQGGHIDKYIGDNVMALFGAPIAHEDDPERACKAALNMQQFLSGFADKLFKKIGVRLKMRIGINCGLVLSGAIGSTVKKEYSVLGDNVNLASRLESNAPPGGILISDSVAQRISNFSLSESKEIMVKGKSEPVLAHVLTGLKQQQFRPVEEQTRFVGRSSAISALRKAINKKSGPVSVFGAAGSGKTRFVYEFLKKQKKYIPFWGKGLKQSEILPYGFIRQFFTENLKFVSGNANLADHPEQLQSFLLALKNNLDAFVPALMHLLFPDSFAAPDRDAKMLRRTTEAGLVALLRAMDQKFGPVILVIDSFDLVDGASVDIIRKILSNKDKAEIPAIIISRKKPQQFNWAEQIKMLPLSSSESGSLLKAISNGKNLSPKSIELFQKKAEGNPLFLIELAKWASNSRSNKERSLLPPSLRAIAVSRLDQLSKPSHDFLCACSVQGENFNPGIALKAADFRNKLLKEKILPELYSTDILEHESLSTDNSWSFRLNLFQEICYETMMIKDRMRLHLATAKALKGKSSVSKAHAPEILAFHFEKAKDWKNSTEAKISAARNAISFGLHKEAQTWFNGALSDVGKLSSRSRQNRTRLFSIYQGLTLVQTKTGATDNAVESCKMLQKYSSSNEQKIEALRLQADIDRILGNFSEAEASFIKAKKLFEKVEKCSCTALFLFNYAEQLLKAARFEEATEAAKSFRSCISRSDSRTKILSETIEGKIAYAQGNVTEARKFFLKAYKAAQKEQGLSEKAKTANHLGNVERDTGNYAKARKYYLAALKTWETTGDIEGIAGANNNLGNLAMSVGDFSLAHKHHTETLKSWISTGNVAGMALSQANLAILSLELDDGLKAIEFAKDAAKNLGAGKSIVLLALIKVIEGEGYLLENKISQAKKVFKAVLGNLSSDKTLLPKAGALRGMGKVSLAQHDIPKALELLSEAEELYLKLKRTQEAARTAVCIAEALLANKKNEAAMVKLEGAQKDFKAMKAKKDLTKVRSLKQKINRS